MTEQANQEKDPGKDRVIIVGAGVAGLVAARDLAREGLNVILLEVRDRLGGRAYTLPTKPGTLPIELGAEFIHGTPVQTWNIVKEARLRVYEVPYTHGVYDRNGLRRRDDFSTKLDGVLAEMAHYTTPDRSFQQFIDEAFPLQSQDPTQNEPREWALSYIENFEAADPTRIGIAPLVQTEQRAQAGETGQGKAFRLINGYASLVDTLHSVLDPARVQLHLNTLVQTIEWQRDSIKIKATTNLGEPLPAFEATRCIVTLPVGVLKAQLGMSGAVRFDPPLKEKFAALDKLEMGKIVKLVLRFKEAFWENHPLGIPNDSDSGPRLTDLTFLHDQRGPFPTWWTTLPEKAPVITAWAGGPAAEKLVGESESGLVKKALGSLAAIFNLKTSELEKVMVGSYHHDWINDPFSQGAYSYSLVNGAGAAQALSEPLEQSLFFAGEATFYEGESGTVHGAIDSGERAARQVLESLK